MIAILHFAIFHKYSNYKGKRVYLHNKILYGEKERDINHKR